MVSQYFSIHSKHVKAKIRRYKVKTQNLLSFDPSLTYKAAEPQDMVFQYLLKHSLAVKPIIEI